MNISEWYAVLGKFFFEGFDPLLEIHPQLIVIASGLQDPPDRMDEQVHGFAAQELGEVERVAVAPHAGRVRNIFYIPEIFREVGMLDAANGLVESLVKFIWPVKANNIYRRTKELFKHLCFLHQPLVKILINGRIVMQAYTVAQGVYFHYFLVRVGRKQVVHVGSKEEEKSGLNAHLGFHLRHFQCQPNVEINIMAQDQLIFGLVLLVKEYKPVSLLDKGL